MSEIQICRNHGKSLAEAREAAERLAEELREDLDMSYAWEGDIMRFKRSGVNGELSVDEREVAIRVKLGLLLSAFKPVIEQEIHKFFDENFPA